MLRFRSMLIPAFSLALAAGAPAGPSSRVQALSGQVRGLRDALGAAHDFRLVGAQTDLDGTTRVNFRQTYQGLPVWGSRASARMDASGRLAPVRAQVFEGIAVATRPTLTEAGALQRAVADLAPAADARALPGKADLVVFPTRFQDGIKVRLNPATGQFEIDSAHSVATRPIAEPYRLAYHVRTRHQRANGEPLAMDFIVDARTGSILKKWDGLQHAGEPALGTGHGYHHGTVPVNTTLREDGQFTLLDRTRGSVMNPQGQYNPWLVEPGMATGFFGYSLWEGFANPVNEWGDGLAYQEGLDIATAVNAQTAAVDAHHGAANAWDFFERVFGRNGFDNQGTSLVIATHVPDWWTGEPRSAKASYDGWYHQLNLGDGKVNASWTSQDIIGHELSHALAPSTGDLDYQGERKALDEANSDIFATLIEFWAKGERGAAIPDQGGNWTIGEQVEDFPVRTLYKPSLDGTSLDAWCDGSDYLGAYSAAGIANRFFYFLAQGTSPDPDRQSSYLPAGMTGIGNTKAAHIWYTALTGYLSPTADFMAAREATLLAAEELHGPDSPELRAVRDAWKAVNVDPASIHVILPKHARIYNTVSFFLQAGEAMRLQAEVQNATDRSLRWSLWGGTAWTAETGGRMSEDGVYQTPFRHAQGFGIKAASLSDPGQSALGVAWIVDLDVDQDAEIDIFDLGALALSYQTYPSLPTADMDGTTYTGESDLSIFHNALNGLLRK